MPLPRRKPPLDPPEIVAVRMRMQEEDASTVLAKTADGHVVQMLTNGELHEWPDGDKRPFRPWLEPVDKEVREALKPGIAESCDFRWVNTSTNWMPLRRGRPRWQPVERAGSEVHCPYAYGDTTGANWMQGSDLMLHKRDRDFATKVRRERAMYEDPKRYLDAKEQELNETAKELGGKKAGKVKQTFEAAEQDAVTFVPDA